jgi:diguanylate cyclase (GGDEF)-like protein
MLAEEDALVVRAVTKNQKHLIGKRMKRDEAMLSWQVFETHKPLVLGDYSTWIHRKDKYDELSLHAVAGFPILNNEQCMGVLALGSDKPNYEFNQDQIQFGGLFASLAALIITNTQLRETLKQQSIRDPLTGLFNRRYMEEMLKREVSRVTRHLRPLGVIMIDIDHFKRFNDTFGHAEGDRLLRDIGRFLQGRVRGEDIACRYGGEEFILILPDASLEIVQKRAEQLCREVNGPTIHPRHGITLSLGVAVYPQHGRTIEAVLRAADVALYRAKQEGRNRVVVAEEN